MKTINIECTQCGSNYDKVLKEYRRQRKKGRKDFYCSKKCYINSMKGNTRRQEYNMGKPLSEKHKKNIRKSKSDIYSPFREFVRRAKRRNKECNLTVDYVKDVWDQQEGKCAITKVPLSLEFNSNRNYQASLDRIDSSKGYVTGNIRFTSVTVNYACNDKSDKLIMEFIEICKNI